MSQEMAQKERTQKEREQKEREQKIPIKNRNLPLSGKLRIFYKKTYFLIKTND